MTIPSSRVAYSVELTDAAWLLDMFRFWRDQLYFLWAVAVILDAMVETSLVLTGNYLGIPSVSTVAFYGDLVGHVAHFLILAWGLSIACCQGRRVAGVAPRD